MGKPHLKQARAAERTLRKAYAQISAARDEISNALTGTVGLTRSKLEAAHDCCNKSRGEIYDAMRVLDEVRS